MSKRVDQVIESFDEASQFSREVLVEQNLWLIRLRWMAVVGIIITALGGKFFNVLETVAPIHICAGLLLFSNVIYYLRATRKVEDASSKDLVLAIIQVEADLIILTAVLHFSGGVTNPFILFYIFHVIIATIILTRTPSFAVGLTAIALFGVLAFNEMNLDHPLGYFPLSLNISGGLWRNPVYVLGGFIAFSCTVMLAQYLTRIVITRMTIKELEAAQNNDLLKAVISAMAEGLIFIRSDGQTAICNPAANLWKKYGYVDDTSSSLDDFPDALCEHAKALVSGQAEPEEAENVIKFNTGETDDRYVEARSCQVTGIDGKKLGYVIVGQDLTEHKKLQKELEDQTEEVTAINEMLKMSRVKMAQREKMVAIGQMASGIAHEIGNPLASLSSVAQYLGRKLRTHEEKEYLLLIQSQVKRISDILKRMLSLSRPATAEYKWADINEIIDNTLSLVKFDKRMNLVKIDNVANSDLPMVWFNPQSFEQVLLNLFINALDAMSAVENEQEHILGITRQSVDGMIEVRISDTGIGMDPETCKRAFESFFTTKEIGKGTGLGLFISYNLINEIDGTINMESVPGKGTTVILRMPVRPKKDLIGGEDEPDTAGSTAGVEISEAND
jgi:signal transduction histidine kinase